METYVKPTKRSRPGKRNCKNKKATAKKSSSNPIDNTVSNYVTEFDEAEQLCLRFPNFNRDSLVETNQNSIDGNYPKKCNVNKYQNCDKKKRTYRNFNDLRNNIHKEPEQLIQGICFKKVRGEKCQDVKCTYGHEFRLPKNLRLCIGWKNGFCINGQLCFNLHSEFPCRYHYLGLNSRHDPKTCRYSHGGPLPKDYEDMFLDSVNQNHFPMAREMYKNQLIKLKAKVCNLIDNTLDDTFRCNKTTEQQRIQNCSNTLQNRKIEKSIVTDADDILRDSDVCKRKDQKCSPPIDESSLNVDENSVRVDENSLRVDESSVRVDENGIEIDESISHQIGQASLQIDKATGQFD